MIDDRTTHRSYALPHQDNQLFEDVTRIKESFENVDLDVDDLYGITDILQSGSAWHAQSSGLGNDYKVTLDPPPIALVPGQFVHMEAHITNTGPATLDVNSIGAKSIKKPDGSDLEAEEILLNGIAYLVYNGNHFQLLNVSGTTEEQEARFLSNDFINYDLIQKAHPGAIAVEKGWSDSFGNADEQGADEANSTDEQYDSSNKLYHGVPGSTNSNSDKDYSNESEYQEQEWTNANQITSQATVASGTTVTLSSGTWPTNVTNARISFDGGSTFYNISSRDSGTQLTLDSSATDGTFDYVIRMTIIESSQFSLNKIAAPVDSNTVLLLHMDGLNGSTSIVDSSSYNQTITVSGNAQIDTSKSKFGGSSVLFDRTSAPITVTDNGHFDFNGDYTIDLWFNVTSSNPGGFITHHQGGVANHGLFINRQTIGKIQVQDDVNGVYTEYGSGLNDGNWHHLAWVRQGSGSSNNTIYIDGNSVGSFTATSSITISADVGIGYYIQSGSTNDLEGYIDELRVSKDIARWTSNFTPPTNQYHNDQNVINEYVSTVDTFVQKENTSAWFDINSANVTESLNSQNAYYWLSFDPASDYGTNTEVKIFNQTGSVWRKIARNNGGTWQYNSDATITAETWVDATTNDMLHAVSEAIDSQAENRMTGIDLAAITDIEWEASNGFSSSIDSLARGVTLHSTNMDQYPLVDQFRIVYDSEPSAMDLRSKAFDPDGSPKKAFLWAKAEHSDIEGSGTFYVSRNGGTDWEGVPMIQQGKPISGNIRILRSIHKFTTGSGNQDLRCRYVTEQGKLQKLHGWGLQAQD